MVKTRREKPTLSVVAGVLVADGRTLIAQRQRDQHGSGLWEFPGGKYEAGESASDALIREMYEELGIKIADLSLFSRVEHDYPERAVEIEFYRVGSWRGRPVGREGQRIKWQSIAELNQIDFLPANEPLVKALMELS